MTICKICGKKTDFWNGMDHPTQGMSMHYQCREEFLEDPQKYGGLTPKELETEASKINNVIDSFCITAESKEGTHRLALFLYIHKNKNKDIITKQVKNQIDSLPKYKQPYWIKTITKVPQTATGKIIRNDLKKIIESKT